MNYMWSWWWMFSWVVPMLLLAWIIFGFNYRRYGNATHYERYRDYWDDDHMLPVRASKRIVGDKRGRGPRKYVRADARIRDDICDRLLLDAQVDASAIDVNVANGVVTLSGVVASRHDKRIAEWHADSVPGVTDVANNLRIGDIADASEALEFTASPDGQSSLPTPSA